MTNTENQLSNLSKNVLNVNEKTADKIFLFLLWIHVPLGGVILPWNYGNIKEGLIISLFLAIVASVSYIFLKGEFINRLLNGIILMSFSILFISLQYGRIEMHFHVFTSLPFLILYRDWKIFPPAAILIIIHHAFFNYCQVNNVSFGGFSPVVFNYDSGWSIVFLHFSFVLAQVLILSFFAKLLQEQYLFLKNINVNLEKQVENRTKLIQKQQATLIESSRLSALGLMAGGVAHEVNNPLTIIIGNGKKLSKLIEKGEASSTKLLEIVDKIENTSFRIQRIINGLRVISRDSSNEKLSIVSVKEIRDDVLGLCRERFQINGVNLNVDISDEILNIQFYCHRTQIAQVLTNLLSNAFDEVCELKGNWVKIVSNVEDEYLVFKVIDNGKGIPMENRKQIFDPFYTTKEVGKGTGLGLSLSKSLVEASKGKLFIDEEHEHTCFVIELPLEITAS